MNFGLRICFVFRASDFVFGCLIGLLCGCTASDPNLPKLYPVAGVVTLDEMPLAGAYVNLIPTGSTLGTGASGMTDAEGKFALSTLHQGRGAAAGDYKVVISKLVQLDGSDFPPDPNRDMMSTPHKNLLRKAYSDPDATTLTAQVAEAGKPLEFVLKSKP